MHVCLGLGFFPLNFNFNFLAPAARPHSSPASCLPEILAGRQQLCLWKEVSLRHSRQATEYHHSFKVSGKITHNFQHLIIRLVIL